MRQQSPLHRRRRALFSTYPCLRIYPLAEAPLPHSFDSAPHEKHLLNLFKKGMVLLAIASAKWCVTMGSTCGVPAC